MRRSLVGVIASLLLMVAGCIQAVADNRVALVIGNADYEHARKLNSPSNDAELVDQALTKVGFDVTRLRNADFDAMDDAIRKFGRALRTPDAVGFFYFAGHAIQVAGRNYLIPVDANLSDENEVGFDAVDINQFLQNMRRAGGRVGIVVLDASRGEPFASAFRVSRKGLAAMDAPFGTLIAYAAAPDTAVDSGTNDINPYPIALARAIETPSLDVIEVFEQVRRDVRTATGGKQKPWESSALLGSFHLEAGAKDAIAAESAPPTSKEQELEAAFWKTVQKDGTRSGFEMYLDLYPDGNHADLAKERLASLPVRKSPPSDTRDPELGRETIRANRDFENDEADPDFGVPLEPSDKVALVIGIDRYPNLPARRQLRKAVNDSVAVARKLHSLGFNIVWAKAVDRRSFLRKLSEFKRLLKPGGTAAVFFAGHGVEINDANYLLPSDVPKLKFGDEEVLRGESIGLSRILSVLQEKQTRINIVILDACRDNPFAEGSTRSLGSSRGLAIVKPPRGTFVMYSAGAHQTALDRLSDNDSSPNSVFTRSLLPFLGAVDLSLQSMAKLVQRDVTDLAQRVGHKQNPAYYDEIIGHYYLRGSGKKVQIASPLPPELEQESSGQAAPDSSTSGEVKLPHDHGATGRKITPERAGENAFRKCLEGTDLSCYEAFLNAHPKHRRVEQAEKIIRTKLELPEFQKCMSETDEIKKLAVCEFFLVKFPDGRFRYEVETLVGELKKKRSNRRFASKPPEPQYQPSPPSRSFTIYRDYDLPYSDLTPSGLRGYTFDGCRQACRQNTRCKAFTFNSNFSVCFLKHSVPQLKPHGGAISGALKGHSPTVVQSTGVCGANFRTFDNVDFYGNDISRKGYAVGLFGCRQLCLNNSRCRGFSWIKPVKRVSRRCWLKFAVGQRITRSYVTSCARH